MRKSASWSRRSVESTAAQPGEGDEASAATMPLTNAASAGSSSTCGVSTFSTRSESRANAVSIAGLPTRASAQSTRTAPRRAKHTFSAHTSLWTSCVPENGTRAAASTRAGSALSSQAAEHTPSESKGSGAPENRCHSDASGSLSFGNRGGGTTAAIASSAANSGATSPGYGGGQCAAARSSSTSKARSSAV